MPGTRIRLFGKVMWWMVLYGALQASMLLLPDVGRRDSLSQPTSEAPSERTIRIDLKARQFDPPHIILTAGEPTTLALHNLDAELHAFVPVGLLTNVHLSVTGDGAPEFSDHGLARLILPSEGKAAIHFVPRKPGRYPYFCDMPGHSMRGMIEVEGP